MNSQGKPNEGYEIDKVTVTDSKGNNISLTDKGDGKRFGDHTFPSKEYHSDAKKATYF